MDLQNLEGGSLELASGCVSGCSSGREAAPDNGRERFVNLEDERAGTIVRRCSCLRFGGICRWANSLEGKKRSSRDFAGTEGAREVCGRDRCVEISLESSGDVEIDRIQLLEVVVEKEKRLEREGEQRESL